MGIGIQMIDPAGIERTGPPFDPVNRIAFIKQEFTEISSVLTGYTGD